MEELIKQVSERAGISEEQARAAVETVAGFLKNAVPPPYNSMSTVPQLEGGGGLGSMLADVRRRSSYGDIWRQI